ncbi:hypothetical protein R3P38DRAFT_3070036 [Favolaschia claudopus]|uniref:BTB domain-containing protein n=1 Tax=Favolaschia claudopus TaxID=2862362 RepID=A0AAW0A029_9AGAR
MESTVVTRSAARARQSASTVSSMGSLSAAEASPKRKLEPDSADASILNLPSLSPKRTKTTSFAKHSRFWALDGNVILQFDSVAFKLHRSRLSTQSVWFEKLFEKRAGREERLEDDEQDIVDVVVEDLDGTDVYHLEGVLKAVDFEALLTAMDEAIDYFYDPPPFLTLTAIFRAAKKLKFSRFEAFTKKYLLRWFSDDLELVTTDPVPHPEEAVELGRECNLPRTLKRAFYEILRTAPAPDGGDDEASDEGQSEPEWMDGWDKMDILNLNKAQKHIAAEWQSALVDPKLSASCHIKDCGSSRRGATMKLIGDTMQKYPLDPICGLKALNDVRWSTHQSFCKSCATRQRKFFTDKRSQIWNDLDRWLDIPDEEESEQD